MPLSRPSARARATAGPRRRGWSHRRCAPDRRPASARPRAPRQGWGRRSRSRRPRGSSRPRCPIPPLGSRGPACRAGCAGSRHPSDRSEASPSRGESGERSRRRGRARRVGPGPRPGWNGSGRRAESRVRHAQERSRLLKKGVGRRYEDATGRIARLQGGTLDARCRTRRPHPFLAACSRTRRRVKTKTARRCRRAERFMNPARGRIRNLTAWPRGWAWPRSTSWCSCGETSSWSWMDVEVESDFGASEDFGAEAAGLAVGAGAADC